MMQPAYPLMTDPCLSIRGIKPKFAEPSDVAASVAVLVTKLGWEKNWELCVLNSYGNDFLNSYGSIWQN